MKKILAFSICFILFKYCSFGQTIHKEYLDGEVYMKIKKDVPFVFDTLSNKLDIKSKLPFLVPVMNKYNITKAESSFYFSKSDKLKRTFRIHFNRIEMVDQLISVLKNMNQVEYVEKIPVLRTIYAPNDLLPNQVSGQYALYNIHAREAWDVTRGSRSVTVAVIDNAIDISHPDLAPNVTQSWDIANFDTDPTPPNSNSNWKHGTHTSGIACASTDNGIGIASIGFNCGLMAVKATSDFSSNPKIIDFGYEGIEWAALNGADVISCSWGGESSITGQITIDDAYNSNAIVVAAAGNDGKNTPYYPAAFDHVIAVAAVGKADGKAGFSNYGSWVDVSAPGISIYSTLPGNTYGTLDGTSMATPMVAGLCGLVRALNPGLSYDQVVSDVINSADNIDAQNPNFIGQLGSGRINAFRAVEAALTCNPSINLGSGVYTTLKTESSGTITSSNTIPSGNQVYFDAAAVVDLLPGFIANANCLFRAYIDGCGNNLGPTYESKKLSVKNQAGEVTKDNSSANSINVSTVNVFPNPSNGKISIRYRLGNATNVFVSIYNSAGAIVYRAPEIYRLAGTYDMSVDLSGYANGIYLLEFKTHDGVHTTKVMIEH